MRSLTVVAAAALVLLPAAPAWAANAAPVAVDDAVDVRSSIVDAGPVPIDALANDSDPDGDPLTYTAVTPPARGTATLEGGRLMYRFPYRAEGTDTFTYTVTDGQGNTATGTVTVALWVDPGTPRTPAITIPAPGSATMTWTAAPGAVQYRIYRDGVVVDTTSALTWTDSGLLDGTAYRYAIAGLNGGGFEGLPQWLTRNQRLLTPSDLRVLPVDDPAAVSLVWQRHGSSGPWRVYRDGALVATTNDPRWVDRGLVTGREYGYQVQLVDRPTPFDYDVSPDSALTDVVRATPAPLSPIARLYLLHLVRGSGAGESDLGAVTVPERAVPGGRQQDHVNGLIAQRDGGPAVAVLYDFATTYVAAGGVSSELGYPIAPLECGLRDGGCAQSFEGGGLWAWQIADPRIVLDEVHIAWARHSRESGRLGYPTDDVICGLRADGCFQEFQGGSIYSSPATGTHSVFTPYEEVWARHGWEEGRLGYPTKDEECGPVGACYQQFQGGILFWTPATGVRAVFTPYNDFWGNRGGGITGRLGAPTTDEICTPGRGCHQNFQGGTIHWSPATGMHAVFTPYGQVWARHGGDAGRLGYPTSNEICTPGRGCHQNFQGGTIHWSPVGGMHAVFTPYGQVWARHGGDAGRFGYPLTEEICTASGCRQEFQGASVYWSPAGGIHAVFGGLRDTWLRYGGPMGRLGYPLGGEGFWAGAYRQNFQGGTIAITGWGPQITYR
ncbi:Ig-like domain-containing protein [Blastococcus sp. CCUG 61487]|uniref:Ig-like domain-containing protein n=1 Tax=Blastococcus sp. CCUG 61487 TaxID=1840703 RepID=UPI0010BFA994|nr:Ig-like domain-containing protein [Blastococcus sp. CCUG 61487]TKJ28501.1 hypothetical protein A6V29_00225 [Blastococcus sp. CCUG 61487]